MNEIKALLEKQNQILESLIERIPDKNYFNMNSFLQTKRLTYKFDLNKNNNIYSLFDGTKFFVPNYPQDFIARHIVETGKYFENNILQELNQYIPQNANILDIGSNIGNHSIYWAKYKNANIISFEPVSITFELLSKNIELNNLQSKIQLHNFALGEQEGFANVHYQEANNLGATALKQEKNGNIIVKKLDDLNLNLAKIDFIKIDVEGFDLQVLNGAINTIKKFKPTIFIESSNNIKKYGFSDTFPQIKSFFIHLGFYDEPIAFEASNYLFIPNSLKLSSL